MRPEHRSRRLHYGVKAVLFVLMVLCVWVLSELEKEQRLLRDPRTTCFAPMDCVNYHDRGSEFIPLHRWRRSSFRPETPDANL